ncbi:MAG: hypothetical protein GY708_09580 [Actinomycetia bacterium]|nr:hypothetical protein [Actinomycetes bacterium]MCP4960416.1 hypothetical protein [Actinomycetes bacterium]
MDDNQVLNLVQDSLVRRMRTMFSPYLAGDRAGALEALDRFTDLNATGELSEFTNPDGIAAYSHQGDWRAMTSIGWRLVRRDCRVRDHCSNDPSVLDRQKQTETNHGSTKPDSEAPRWGRPPVRTADRLDQGAQLNQGGQQGYPEEQ